MSITTKERPRWEVKRYDEPDYTALRSNFDFEGVERIVMGFAQCRSGTTAALQVAAALLGDTGVRPIYQPGKAAWRCIEHPQAKKIPDKTKLSDFGKTVVLKETIGPHTPAECNFNPLRVYEADEVMADGKGVPPEKLYPILYERNPYDTLLSWNNLFGAKYKVPQQKIYDHFLWSAETVQDIYLEVEDRPHTVFAQELLQHPIDVTLATDNIDNGQNPLANMLRRLHVARLVQQLYVNASIPVSLEQSQSATQNWKNLEEEAIRRRIQFPTEPPYPFDEALMPSFTKGGYQFSGNNWRQARDRLTPYEQSFIDYSGLPEFYNDMLAKSIAHLDVEGDYQPLFIDFS